MLIQEIDSTIAQLHNIYAQQNKTTDIHRKIANKQTSK